MVQCSAHPVQSVFSLNRFAHAGQTFDNFVFCPLHRTMYGDHELILSAHDTKIFIT